MNKLNLTNSLDKKQLQEYLSEVSSKLAALPGNKSQNHYNCPTQTIGLTVPQSRNALKAGYSFLKLLPEQRLQVFDHIWNNSRFFEEMSQAIYYYEKKSLTPEEFKVIATWIDRCDNWAHSDGLSSIYARALEENPVLVLPVLKSWNKSTNLWKRRQSLVSLLYYHRARRQTQPFAVMISLVEQLLDDPEYYVQKGLGWTLREIYNCFPEPTLSFIRKNVRKIAPAAWQATTEKLPPYVKKSLLAIRHGS